MLKEILANGTGFQRIISLLAVSTVNADEKLAFVPDFTCIHVSQILVTGKGNCWIPANRTLVLVFDKLRSLSLFHEATHAYHSMIGCVSPKTIFTNLAIIKSDNLINLFYPMLLFDNNRSVQVVIDAIKNKLPIIRNSKDFKNAMKVMFIGLMGQGFGELLPSDVFRQNRTLDTLISYVKTPDEKADDFLAKALYISAITPIWTSTEEMSTILGMQINVDNTGVIIEDRQNELIEVMRDNDKKNESPDALGIQNSAFRTHSSPKNKTYHQTNKTIELLVNVALYCLFKADVTDPKIGPCPPKLESGDDLESLLTHKVEIKDPGFFTKNDLIKPSKLAHTNDDMGYEIKKDAPGITDVIDDKIRSGDIVSLVKNGYDFSNTDNPQLEEYKRNKKIFEVIAPQKWKDGEFDVPMATILCEYEQKNDWRALHACLKNMIEAGKDAVYTTLSGKHISKNKITGQLEQNHSFLSKTRSGICNRYLFDALQNAKFTIEDGDENWENLIKNHVEATSPGRFSENIPMVNFILLSKNSKLLEKAVRKILEIIRWKCPSAEMPGYEESLGDKYFSDKHWKAAEKHCKEMLPLMQQFSLIDMYSQIPHDTLRARAPGKNGIGQNAYVLYEDILNKLDFPEGIAGALNAFNESYLSFNECSLLHIAASEVNPNNLRRILGFVENIPKKDKDELLQKKDKDGKTALEIAVRFGRTEAQELLAPFYAAKNP
jgi:hypothetical protein